LARIPQLFVKLFTDWNIFPAVFPYYIQIEIRRKLAFYRQKWIVFRFLGIGCR